MWDRLKELNKHKDIVVAMGVVGIVMMMVLPIPPFLMDLFLALSITMSLIILLTTMYVLKPLEFSIFPSVLLVVTLYRLALNIGTTRLILINGHSGTHAAGKVIQSFGQFVVSGNYAVGIIVFIILIIINFVVITKGAGRIAEVAARFVLDSMPGKQMSIDADLNAGIIRDVEAKARRREIEREADFYGAMDGASKFVRGDAIAGLLITAINIIGGIVVGVLQHNLPVGQAAATYTILTVGDGLVSQVPALVTSTAAGILVTRTASENSLGSDMYTQIMRHWKALAMVGFFMLGFSVIPGMPMLVFLIIGVVLITLAYYFRKDEQEAQAVAQKPEEEKAAPQMTESERLETMLPLDLLEVEVGYGLINLVDARQGGEVLERITALRRQFVGQYGLIIPPIHIRDNLQLDPNEYVIKLKGNEIARSSLMPDRFLAMNPGEAVNEVSGVDTVEPAFGLPAKWVRKEQRDQAESLGYTVVDASTVMATHLSEVLKASLSELLGRQELQQLLDIFSRNHPRIVEDLIPGLLTAGEVMKVLKNLLKEQISIRDLRTILETLADTAHQTKNTEVLSEIVRQRLGKTITGRFRSHDGQIYAILLDKKVEDLFRNNQRIMDDEIVAAISPDQAKRLLAALEKQIRESSAQVTQPVLLVSPEIRKAIYNFIKRVLPDLPVISHRELDATARIQLVGTVAA